MSKIIWENQEPLEVYAPLVLKDQAFKPLGNNWGSPPVPQKEGDPISGGSDRLSGKFHKIAVEADVADEISYRGQGKRNGSPRIQQLSAKEASHRFHLQRGSHDKGDAKYQRREQGEHQEVPVQDEIHKQLHCSE